MRKVPWQRVTAETDKRFSAQPVVPTAILTALHQARGLGWHVWYDGKRLIVAEMDVRWRARLYLKPVECHYHVNVAAGTDRQTWVDWLRSQFPEHRIFYVPSRARHGKPRTPGASNAKPTVINPAAEMVKLAANSQPLTDTDELLEDGHDVSHLKDPYRIQELAEFVGRTLPGFQVRLERPHRFLLVAMHNNQPVRAVAQLVGSYSRPWLHVGFLIQSHEAKLRAEIETAFTLFVQNRFGGRPSVSQRRLNQPAQDPF